MTRGVARRPPPSSGGPGWSRAIPEKPGFYYVKIEPELGHFVIALADRCHPDAHWELVRMVDPGSGQEDERMRLLFVRIFDLNRPGAMWAPGDPDRMEWWLERLEGPKEHGKRS